MRTSNQSTTLQVRLNLIFNMSIYIDLLEKILYDEDNRWFNKNSVVRKKSIAEQTMDREKGSNLTESYEKAASPTAYSKQQLITQKCN